MNNWWLRLLLGILFPKPTDRPNIKNLREIGYDQIVPESLVKGTVWLGEAGAGKTSSAGLFLHEIRKAHPDWSGYVIDYSSPLIRTSFKLIGSEPQKVREEMLRKTRFFALGHPKYVMPIPEFSLAYGNTYHHEIERVRQNLARLNPELVTATPFAGGLPFGVLAPELMRVLAGIRTQFGGYEETWQITEIERFINNPKLLSKAFSLYGENIPLSTRETLTAHLLNVKKDQEFRLYPLTTLFSPLRHPYARAHLGYPETTFIPKEFNQNGIWSYFDCSGLNTDEPALNYLVTQIFSLIMSEVNKRQPDNRLDKPVVLMMDEVYTLFGVPGLAEIIGRLPALYRTRKLLAGVCAQALWQFDEQKLLPKIWNYSNIISFRLADKNDALAVAKQLGKYNPQEEKMPAATDRNNPILENEQGMDRQVADWITDLSNRRFLMRRYLSPYDKDPFIRHGRTRDLPRLPSDNYVEELQEWLLKRDGVLITEAEEVIEERSLENNSPSQQAV